MPKSCEHIKPDGAKCGFPKVWANYAINGVMTPLCKLHYYQIKNPIKIDRKSKKQVKQMKQDKVYYRVAVAKNIIKNKGVCRCDNCYKVISRPSGSNVSHIISKGSNSTLYHHELNHFILCLECEQLFSNTGKRSEMKIYPEFLKRHEQLNLEYYQTKNI